MTAPPFLEAIDLNKAFFDPRQKALIALAGISFQEHEGEFLTVIGPSGCGKSTLLRLLGALELPDSGEVRFRGELLAEPRREIGYVFQRSNLMPWRTVLRNVELPLEINHAAR